MDETSIGELRLHPFLAAATPLKVELDPISEREARVLAEMDADTSVALALNASGTHVDSAIQCADDTVRRQGLCGMLSARVSDGADLAMLRAHNGDLTSGGSLRVQLMRSSRMSDMVDDSCLGADSQPASSSMASIAVADLSLRDFSSPLVLKVRVGALAIDFSVRCASNSVI